MSNLFKWNFPLNNDGPDTGINDTGLEHFQGTPIKSLAREICQNSLDAVYDSQKPVLVQFKSFNIAFSDIPDSSALIDAFERSKNYWQVQNYSKVAVNFFEKAIAETKKDKIPCLRISDFNTNGLSGSDAANNTPWYNLTKSQGVSDKAGTAGGSKGIGKYAPFVCSSLRTVFYSTLDSENKQASQGISRLTTFRNKNNETTQGIGFCGLDKNKPFFVQTSMDHNFNVRSGSDYGTDIYIIGFKDVPDWKKKIAASVIDGFLYAIYTNKLIVEIDDIMINKDMLSELAVSLKDYFEENADKYYAVLSADDKNSSCFTKNIYNKGTVTLKMMIRPDLHRRAAIVRKTGMKIFDKDRINGRIPFAGVLYIDGSELNEILRDLENAQHTKWEFTRSSNEALAKKVTKEIFGFIKESLNTMIKDDSQENLDAFVGEYLAAENSTENTAQNSENVNDLIFEIQTRQKDLTKDDDQASRDPDGNNFDNSDASAEDDEEDRDEQGKGYSSNDDNDDDSDDDDNNNSNQDHGNTTSNVNSHNPQKSKKRTVVSANFRIICVDKNTGSYRLSIVPNESASDCCIQLMMSAETNKYDAEIKTVSCNPSSNISFSGGKITNVSLTKGVSLKIDFTINYSDYCSMEASIWK